MTSRETLPELIHRLVEAKGRVWVERELDYGPDVIDHHLGAFARASRAPRPGPADPPSQVTREPVPQLLIAYHLKIRRETLSRALRNDPSAPAPVPAPDADGKRWLYAEVHAWWPNRRKRGSYPRPSRQASAPRPPGEEPA
ncbi:hypothetical protein OG413_40915 [Streptomyces sp. NBC_01433]|uniref:hypothetical protein n=1 Tax=Streptomyces sp. NBC_01433 TaxID=2903864 RepID=UPI0022581EF7|nr:hypothetical protein [Streptomyces sp. NBC_01433]MCX4681565.1 hypothetical protein [Streptomyces sp. NBC_01433]